METANLFYNYISSPLGEMELCCNGEGLLSVSFETGRNGFEKKPVQLHTILEQTKAQLTEYFEGTRNDFDLPMSLQGTDFQKRVWAELLKIPFGATLSYLQLAKRLGDEKCIRAAASANGRNPVAIIVPCHRVIGSGGSLVGYAGELWRKKWLLERESSQARLF